MIMMGEDDQNFLGRHSVDSRSSCLREEQRQTEKCTRKPRLIYAGLCYRKHVNSMLGFCWASVSDSGST